MTDAERYRQRAVELERIARERFHPDLRRELLSLARDWREMAKQVERIEDRSFAPPASEPDADPP